ncbi:MAG TPA: carbamoyltransferase HypF [Solirubrobacteraceae bacterium]|nr:carbamoyltransferase HypF [Solirubrobacteraceae bacterium]
MRVRSPAPAAGTVRARVRVEGTVQGVGFRPYVYRLATELSLGGFVLNDARGVEIEVQGAEDTVARFLEVLAPKAPALARVERVSAEPLPVQEGAGFEIRESPAAGTPSAPVTPDSATCPECLAELLDPDDRRFRYPFINCTNCGPRFTIVRGIPYDRPLTTMAAFTMCERCRAEYEDPGDRRFHAQPNACPLCGPTLSLLEGTEAGTPWPTDPGGAGDAIAAAAGALRAGAIVAVKGIGGFHLACRADDEPAVARLRARKHREDKPFALMTADVDGARELVQLGEGELELLTSPARPIVLAGRLPAAAVADSVAPAARELGVMLAYSPVHHLLLADAGVPLVMTSGNVSDEPIAYLDEDALARLRTIADLFLVHDRPIQTRTDDSVARSLAGGAMLLRRSRGHVPASIALAVPAPQELLACGAELKSTFCLARGRRAWVSQHIGDLKNHETLSSFTDGVEHLERLFRVEPSVVAHDLHPDYLSTRYALAREGLETIAVQHHHAHLAACLAEHGETGEAIAAVFDGSGYGSDGTVWGGELLVGGLRDFERAGHLRPVRLPGGDNAVREPWRLACAWLLEASGGEATPPLPPALAESVTAERWETVAQLARTELAPLCTSVGRLFDAVAALCGVRASINYEGQAAIELEGAVDPSEHGAYAIEVASRAGSLELDPREAVQAIMRDGTEGIAVGAIAARFHAGLAHATAEACALLAHERGLELVVLSGGVFQNRTLLELTLEDLRRAGLRVLVPRRLPPGDGGISFGQAAVAAARLAAA